MGLTQITTGGVDNNINIDDGTLKVDGVNNRVGVGITPTAPFHVSGTIQSQTGATVAQMYTDGGAAYFTSVGAYPMLLHTNGSERLRVDSSGNVGIGTSSATDLLTIGGVASPRFGIQSSTTGGDGGIEFGDPSDDNIGFIVYDHSANALRFGANASERLRIDSSGNVGIGTTSPNYELHVNASDTISILQLTNTTTGSTNSDGLLVYQNGLNSFISNQEAGSLLFETSATERMRIDSSGNVGIGVTPNTHNLGKALEIGAEGNVLWGEGAGNIHLLSNAYYNGGYKYATSAPAGRYNIYQNTHTWARASSGTADAAATFTESMRIDSSGRLLIGTSTASSAGQAQYAFLEVSGSTAGLTGSSHINIKRGEAASAMSNGDTLGRLIFTGLTGGDFAYIQSSVDGSPSGSDFPGNLRFFTCADGSSSATERMRITSDGLLRVSNETADSEFFASTSCHVLHSSNYNAAALIVEHSDNSSPYGILIDFSDDSPDNNTNYFIRCADSTQSERMVVWSDGDLDNHDNSYGGTSDQKLKQDIIDAGSQWDDLKDLRVRKFKFKSDVAAYGDEAKTLIGLVAQEAETVCPGLVKDNPDLDEEGNDLGTTTKSVRYSVLYMKAIKALQEAMDRIETLEAKVAALEAAE